MQNYTMLDEQTKSRRNNELAPSMVTVIAGVKYSATSSFGVWKITINEMGKPPRISTVQRSTFNSQSKFEDYVRMVRR